MKKVQQKNSVTLKKWNMKKVQHEEKMESERHSGIEKSAIRKKCSMGRVHHEESATLKECITKKVQHKKSGTRKKCNMIKIVTVWNFKENCTRRMHKNAQTITGRPLTDRYTLVFSVGSTLKSRNKRKFSYLSEYVFRFFPFFFNSI